MSDLSRRDLLVAAGGLTVHFACAPAWAASGGGEGGGGPKPIAPGLPGDLAKVPMLDAWIRIAPDGRATVFTGKAELGQGIKTAIVQLAADELDMPTAQMTLITADTAHTPDEGITAGSHSMQDSGTAIANAAANVRLLLAEEAARRWGLPVDRLKTRRANVIAPDGRALTYAALAAGLSLHVTARKGVARKRIADRHLIGRSARRVDIPAKLTGGAAYVQDMVLPGLLHARVVRGPSEGTRLVDPDLAAVARMPGVTRLVREGRFIAIVGARQWPLMQALRALGQSRWEADGVQRPHGDLGAYMQALPSRPTTILDRRAPGLPPAHALRARYTRPFTLHGSIGPSCAVALWQDGGVTVWTHSQGVAPLARALAELLSLPPAKVRCIHVEGSGCYGHNGADDVAADAAIAARAVPGRPVKLQWTREQEHGWEPCGPAMVVELSGAVDAGGRIVAWRHDVWSNTHNQRPQRAGDLLAGPEIDPAFPKSPPKPIPQPEGGGDRNAIPLYALPSATVVSHFIPAMPLRVSAQRSLGAHMNIFALESFMDELAEAAARDPVAFRLAHLDDPRGRAVIEDAARRFGWSSWRPRPSRGRGFAFARYKNLGAYCALAMDVEVEPETRRVIVHRATAAVDSGDAVNPDGIRNQIEGGIVQSLSWTGLETVTYDARRRTCFDWSGYPILRFDAVPRAIDVHVINRPGMPFLGTGEAAQGPAAAALANGIRAASAQRLRDLPLGRA